MKGLTRNKPLRDLAAVVIAGLLALGVVRACSDQDSAEGDPSVEVESEDEPGNDTQDLEPDGSTSDG